MEYGYWQSSRLIPPIAYVTKMHGGFKIPKGFSSTSRAPHFPGISRPLSGPANPVRPTEIIRVFSGQFPRVELLILTSDGDGEFVGDLNITFPVRSR